MAGTIEVRDALEDELDQLAQIWYSGWQDAHADILPTELARDRTLESFKERLGRALATVRVTGPFNNPTGFCMTKGGELYQLYVSAHARGAGTAAALIADAELKIARQGFDVAWLACAIGNNRAARFYEKSGWQRAGTVVSELDTEAGVFRLEVWRYEKMLRS